jgi:hypothetical protein
MNTPENDNNGFLDVGRDVELKLLDVFARDWKKDVEFRENQIRKIIGLCVETCQLKNNWFFKENVNKSLRIASVADTDTESDSETESESENEWGDDFLIVSDDEDDDDYYGDNDDSDNDGE